MNLYRSLSSAVVEKDVESTYREALRKTLKDAEITSPFGCDGYLHDAETSLHLLMEFKFDLDFGSPLEVGGVLLQALCYLKRFEKDGRRLPGVIFVGDRDECFIVHMNDLNSFLDEEIDWSVAPSAAAKRFPATCLKIGSSVNPFIFRIEPEGDFRDVVNRIIEINRGIAQQARITDKNVVNVFSYFTSRVLKTSLGANQNVGLFINVLANRQENYIHPGKKNILVTKSYGEVSVNGKQFDAFFKHFSRDLTARERENLQAVCDRLIEDEKRRRDGAFFTPTLWVDAAHQLVTEAYGANWRDEFVVWDCAAGTCNLTRDYRFKELYCSTLIQDEVDIANQGGLNPEATKFQFDFLNDDFDKVPQGLKDAFANGKKIMFLINPPYGTANNMGTKEGDHKAGIAQTKMNLLMADDKLGACRQQLYAQFMYRIAKLREEYGNQVVVSMFAPPIYMTAGSFEKMREKCWNQFGFVDGMMFQASHFADVSDSWGISFCVWDSVADKSKPWEVHLADVGELGIEFGEKKLFYNTDGRGSASDWVRNPIKGVKTYDAPQMGSGLVVKPEGRGKSAVGHLGYFGTNGNSIYDNGTFVYILSEVSSRSHGCSILPSNFDRVATLFSARKSVGSTWINQKDEYIAPDESHPLWQEYVNDSLVYCLFNTSSQQSSLRQIEYKGKKWDVKNEFFWLAKDYVMDLADKHGFTSCYQDAKGSPERYMYTRMQGVDFSLESRAVLEAARAIYEQCWQYREMMHDEDPSRHLNTWDAGWYQIKIIAKAYLPDELKAFTKLYKVLEEKMRQRTYEVGFLRG